MHNLWLADVQCSYFWSINLCCFIMQAFPLFACMDCVKRMVTVEENGGAMTTQVEQFLLKVHQLESQGCHIFPVPNGGNILCSSIHCHWKKRSVVLNAEWLLCLHDTLVIEANYIRQPVSLLFPPLFSPFWNEEKRRKQRNHFSACFIQLDSIPK